MSDHQTPFTDCRVVVTGAASGERKSRAHRAVGAVVVGQEPMAAEIGTQVLADGGNAMDAAIATAFAQMVFNPFMCGLGGWGDCIYHEAATGKTHHLGFWPRIGSGMHPEMWVDDIKGYTALWNFPLFEDHRNMIGHTSIMTPGVVAGLGTLHDTFGTKPWAELLRPSIDWSNRGYRIPFHIARQLNEPYIPGLPHPREKYCATPSAKALWLRPDGSPKQRGDDYRNPDQARTLEQLASSGWKDFYLGQLADVIIGDFEANGAFVTREDLAGYQPVGDAPLRLPYRDLEVVSSPPPGGGLLLLQALGILNHFDLHKIEHNSPEHIRLVAAALAWVSTTRFNHLADPQFRPVPVPHLLSASHLEELANKVRRNEWPDHSDLNAPGGTTHLCVTDARGNAVTMTHTLTSCSGVVIDGTGFTWNDGVALMDPVPGRSNSYEPGKARASAVAPTLLLRDGRPFMLAGAPGGWSITSAVLHTILNVVDFGMEPMEAVAAPRVHSEGRRVFGELRVNSRALDALQADGVEIETPLDSYSAGLGRAQCLFLDPGNIHGAADPREGGGSHCYLYPESTTPQSQKS